MNEHEKAEVRRIAEEHPIVAPDGVDALIESLEGQENRVFRIIVGEVGSERGHLIPIAATTEAGARRSLAKALRAYGGDGWGYVEVGDGRRHMWWRLEG